MDTLGIEPRASRMLSGCDTTTPRALEESAALPRHRAQQEKTETAVPYIDSVSFLVVCFRPHCVALASVV